MEKLPHSKIKAMDWDQLEDTLQRGATTRASSTRAAKSSDEQALRDYYGDAEYEFLRKLATHAGLVRSRATTLGNVVFLPGIMGSNLSASKGADADLVWINFAKIVKGRFANLRLAPDGINNFDPSYKITTDAIDKRAYTRAILWLRARWRVEPFPFDWRKDLDTASKDLAQFIRDKFGKQPVHLVAHSMGGLVCRNFIRLHRELWEQMRGDSGNGHSSGGRLIMLGTPNYGSYAIPQVLTGVEPLIKWLARVDFRHGRAEILEIVNSFVGSYQMLPAPSKLSASAQSLYRRNTWGDAPVSDVHLQRAFQFHDDLEKENTIDPERMIYIAGSGRPTLSGLRVISPGEFDYTVTNNGDNRVPHELGLLKGVPTYYADEGHGDLPRNETIMSAVDELLERGRTSVLAQQPMASRSVQAEGARWYRSVGERETELDLEAIAQRAYRGEAKADEMRVGEEALQRAVLGREQPVVELPRAAARKERAAARMLRVPLHVKVVRGDITRVAAPVTVVGHYKGVAPTNAVGAIDSAIDYWISRAGENGMIGADLGQLFFIPVQEKSQMKAKSVLLAGMGDAGKFRRDDLRFLMMNVTLAISTLGHDRFATVVIGSGKGSLSKERALRGMLQGICDGLQRLAALSREAKSPVHAAASFGVKQVILVEYDAEQFNEIVKILTKFKEPPTPIQELDLTISKQILPAGRRAKKQRPPDLLPAGEQENRITIERTGDVFRFSALGEDAVIPVREVEVQSVFAASAAERLMASETEGEQKKYGNLLYTYLIPQDFHQLIDSDRPLTLVLDRQTASFPWEMASFTGPRGTTFLGPNLKLTRQFRTMLSSAPGVAPPINRNFKALVIADPAPEPEYQLPGARSEGRAVVNILQQFKTERFLDIEIVERIGATECDPVEILALILNENFDLVHYAGHGIFDEQNPNRSGWVFGASCIMSPLEIFRARRVPRLVFANACFSAVTIKGKTSAAEQVNRQLAGMVEAFFERGIQNYLGSGWPVGDMPGVQFAETFYTNALAGETLGDAIAAGRTRILQQGSTWGAYQHYGHANTTLVARQNA
ncbi:MAG TPA: CHAT domain-containing protein [Pyrinomonadaceae bacterium]|jgi:pimeloyl-ACP methyl ester carboxylesterase